MMLQLQSLTLTDIMVNRRQILVLAHLPRLTSLALDCSDLGVRLNQDGCFSTLASLASLRSFTASDVQSDAGLELATQLTSLDLSLPDHVPRNIPWAIEREYTCACGSTQLAAPSCRASQLAANHPLV
jgi:hypothetical protein